MADGDYENDRLSAPVGMWIEGTDIYFNPNEYDANGKRKSKRPLDADDEIDDPSDADDGGLTGDSAPTFAIQERYRR